MRRRPALSLSRALLLGTAFGCGSLPSASMRLTSESPDAGQVALADASVDGGSDAGVVKLYCWLITDPRCFADGGTAPGTFDAC